MHHLIARAAAGAILALAVLMPGAFGAQTLTVLAQDFPKEFSPKTAKVAVGETVHWTSQGQDVHNVLQNDALFSSGSPTSILDYSVRFSAGTFKYFCKVHGTKNSGMRGTVKVPVTIGEDPAGPAFSILWASSGTESGKSFDVQVKVGSGSWTDFKKNVTAKKATYSAAAKGTKYSVRARSLKGKKKSDWSPTATITP